MADPQSSSYDGAILGNVLVLGDTGSGKTAFVQEFGCKSMFRKLMNVYWITKNALTEQRQGEVDLCFEPQIDYSGAADKFELKKTFGDLKNTFLEK